MRERWGSDHTFVFIGGLHRSGTTQLHATLASNPQVSGMLGTSAPHDEGQHLQNVFPTARQHGGPGRFAFHAGAHLTEESPLCTAEVAARLFSQWAQHWDRASRVLIEKSPPNLVRTRFLQGLFPDARFVLIVRHPIVTALATQKLATTWWMRRTHRQASLAETAEHWFAAHRLMVQDLEHIRHAHILRWEDLCADPPETLARIAAFLAIDPVFELPDLGPHVDDKYVARWAQMGRETPDRDTIGLRTSLRNNADVAALFGYDVTDLRTIGQMSV